MTPFMRWVTFNLVGAVGLLVQLAALALFNRLLHGRYLIASVAALEVALLHNFKWHTQYTWHDCRDSFSLRRQLVRFHLSNGLLSLAGNLALMPLLVHAAHLPVLISNCVSVVCCSVANFWVSHSWTFSAARHSLPRTQPSTRTVKACPLLVLSLVALLTCSKAHAQMPDGTFDKRSDAKGAPLSSLKGLEPFPAGGADINDDKILWYKSVAVGHGGPSCGYGAS